MNRRSLLAGFNTRLGTKQQMLGDALVKLTGLPPLATGFVVGLGGMQLCLMCHNLERY